MLQNYSLPPVYQYAVKVLTSCKRIWNSLDELTYKVNDMETSSNAVSETKISTTSIAAGLIYNFDW